MRSVILFAVVVVSSCTPPVEPTPDAGRTIDTSCGLDCEAQQEYGLILDRCFEYSKSATQRASPPDLGVYVRRVFTLEGDVPTIEVVYYRGGGNIAATDFFTLPDGALTLVRRSPTGATSLTYLQDNKVDGVTWLTSGAVVGARIETARDARLGDDVTGTQYRVDVVEAVAADLNTVDAGVETDGGIKLLFGETPAHYYDSQRVFVPGLGFVRLTPSAAIVQDVPHYLQSVRDIDRDAGTPTCGLGD